MYGDRVSEIELSEHLARIDCHASVKIYVQQRVRGIYLIYDPDIPVENAGSAFAVTFPDNIIIVLYLHHLVTGAEDVVEVFKLPLHARRRVQRELQRLVEVFGADRSHFGRRKHLDIIDGGVAVGFRKSFSDQVNDQLCRFFVPVGRHKEEVLFTIVKLRHLTVDYPVGIGNDQTFGSLPEYLF